MNAFDPVNAKLEEWPPEIGFVPWVGNRYGKFDGDLRVVLLGESHYKSNEIPKREYTRWVYGSVTNPGPREDTGRIYRACDRIVSRMKAPSDEESASGWETVAFANHVQDFVGSAPGDRPTPNQWRDAKRVFPILMKCLKPDVVLVLGKGNFDGTPNSGNEIGHIDAPHKKRSLWEMNNDESNFLMSWIYHPSSRGRKDNAETMIKVFTEILDRKKRE